MTKHTDVLKAALEKKRAAQHPEQHDSKDSKPTVKPLGSAGPSTAGKPMKKVTGRGR